jgi:GntR family transcriptional repressor for pyruvate dehydrogenase complex
MQINLQPIKVLSLKEACITQLEELILTGELQMGARLPSERDLAAQLNVSRPILHEALVDLESKGLLKIIPRHGTVVNDFRRSGSLALLSSLFNYHDGNLDPLFSNNLLDMRLLIEIETARLAALHRTPAQLEEFHAILKQEMLSNGNDLEALISLDFSFHLLIAIASGNLIYPLVINSFRSVYTSLTGAFFQRISHSHILQTVHHYHRQLVEAMKRQDAEACAKTMSDMLKHGEMILKGEII